MTTAIIPFKLFAEQLASVHAWPAEAIESFQAVIIHTELPREDWVRIAAEWASKQDEFTLEQPTVTIHRYGVSTMYNGGLGGIIWEDSEAGAEAYAAELNSHIRGSSEVSPNTRWFAFKVELLFPDSE